MAGLQLAKNEHAAIPVVARQKYSTACTIPVALNGTWISFAQCWHWQITMPCELFASIPNLRTTGPLPPHHMCHHILDHPLTGFTAKAHDAFGMKLHGCDRLVLMLDRHDGAVFRLG